MFSRNNPQKLINSLESLTHSDRILEIVKLGRIEATEPNIATLFDNLQQGNHYERLLALYSCHGSYNEQRVLTAIRDSSRSIRNKAIDLITLVGSDKAVLKAVDALGYRQRLVLFKYLRKRKRLSTSDRCLQKLISSDASKLSELLIYGSEELVENSLAIILERAGINEWRNLAKLHPQLALNALSAYAAKSTARDWRLSWYFKAAIFIAELYPDAVLTLIQNLIDHPSFNYLNFQQLVYYRPIEVAQLVLQLEDRLKIDLNPVAHKLPQDILNRLIDKQPHTVNSYSSWLPKLKPERRREIYQQCNLSWRDKDGCLPVELVKLFPVEIRVKEAKYHLDLPILETRPRQRLPYAAFLPWGETWETVQPYLKNPDAYFRILALKTIINATRYQRSRLPELLEIIKQRKNEQDPVRNAILYGLANLPPSVWELEHLADLDTILTDTLQAADLSQTTGNHAESIVLKILPFHPEWSAVWLSKLVEARGEVNFYNLESRLNNSQVRQLAPILLPVFKSWETREREWNVIKAASSFGKRLEVFEELVDILERLLTNTRNTYYASYILNILSDRRRDRLAFLIPQLLKKDSSWFTQAVVSNYLHNFRQDLLTPYLGQTAYRGKFATGKTYFVVFFYGGYSRWTDRQQNIFARSLDNLT